MFTGVCAVVTMVCLLFSTNLSAQQPVVEDTLEVGPPVTIVADSIINEGINEVKQNKKEMMEAPPSGMPLPVIPDSLLFTPDPMKAVWYSALFPGLGQIYNRRYWKLPIVIGGYMGLIYATSWNNRYYTDYSMAYRDIMDNDPTTNSYINFLPYNNRNDEFVNANLDWLKGSLKRKKDFYRRNRDLCIISMVGLYLVCMIDAYVDAQLYQFDISPDVSMQLLPAVITPAPYSRASLGLQCAITF